MINKPVCILTLFFPLVKDFIYPNGIAFPIGGRSDEQYVVMEMHYNNPSLTSGQYLWSLMCTIDACMQNTQGLEIALDSSLHTPV